MLAGWVLAPHREMARRCLVVARRAEVDASAMIRGILGKRPSKSDYDNTIERQLASESAHAINCARPGN